MYSHDIIYMFGLQHEENVKETKKVPNQHSCEILRNKDNTGRNAFHLAAARDDACFVTKIFNDVNEEVISELLREKDNRGQNVFNIAAENSHNHFFTKTLEEAKRRLPRAKVFEIICDKNVWGHSALHLAAERGLIDMVTLILDEAKQTFSDRGSFEALLWSRNVWGQNLLHLAALYGHSQTVLIILKEALKVSSQSFVNKLLNEKDSNGQSAMDFASQNNFGSAIRF